MNQDQREYLIKEVKQTCDNQIDKLKAKIPDRPSLNNYLIASFLDGSVEFADIKVLKKKMRQTVLKFGTSDLLVKEKEERGWRSRRNNGENEEQQIVEVLAEDLFVIPNAYKKAIDEYKEIKEKIEEEISKLEAVTKTILLKIQIGSSGNLDKLIDQVDNIGDLNLVNTQLLLKGPDEEKKKGIK